MSLKEQFILNFVKDDRYRYMLDGLWFTLQLTLFACLLGIVLGVTIALVRTSHDSVRPRNPVFRFLMNVANLLCKLYLTVIRGTPVVVQLLIIYYVILTAPGVSKLLVGVLAFGVNSGAYAAEIFRSGIQSVDKGQYEAGRSLGMGYIKTMWFVILPQAMRNVMPALVNELITLLKETSVAGYIGLQDLTRGADIIRGQTYSPFMPLIALALVYLLIVMLLTSVLGRLERRLRARD